MVNVKINFVKENQKNKLWLKKFTIKKWNKIDNETCKRLVQSINNRCRAVIDAKERHTRY